MRKHRAQTCLLRCATNAATTRSKRLRHVADESEPCSATSFPCRFGDLSVSTMRSLLTHLMFPHPPRVTFINGVLTPPCGSLPRQPACCCLVSLRTASVIWVMCLDRYRKRHHKKRSLVLPRSCGLTWCHQGRHVDHRMRLICKHVRACVCGMIDLGIEHVASCRIFRCSGVIRELCHIVYAIIAHTPKRVRPNEHCAGRRWPLQQTGIDVYKLWFP